MSTGCLGHLVDPPVAIPPYFLGRHFQPRASSNGDIYLASELRAKVPLERPDTLPEHRPPRQPLWQPLTHQGPTISRAGASSPAS